MKEDDILISNSGSVYDIKVRGRANFEYAVPLRHFANCMSDSIGLIRIEASECTFMDSTFMGVLAMMALRAKKINASISIYNASEQNKTSLCGLGLKRLFTFAEGTVSMDAQIASDAAPVDQKTHAETVLEAHKTLMNVDEGNVEKFEKVVDSVQKDLDRLNEKSE